LKVIGVLSIVLGSTSRVLTKVINTQNGRIYIEKDIAIFRKTDRKISNTRGMKNF